MARGPCRLDASKWGGASSWQSEAPGQYFQQWALPLLSESMVGRGVEREVPEVAFHLLATPLRLCERASTMTQKGRVKLRAEAGDTRAKMCL